MRFCLPSEFRLEIVHARRAGLQLIEAGANFEAQTESGERPLHLAIQRMDINILHTLLDAGANR